MTRAASQCGCWSLRRSRPQFGPEDGSRSWGRTRDHVRRSIAANSGVRALYRVLAGPRQEGSAGGRPASRATEEASTLGFDALGEPWSHAVAAGHEPDPVALYLMGVRGLDLAQGRSP